MREFFRTINHFYSNHHISCTIVQFTAITSTTAEAAHGNWPLFNYQSVAAVATCSHCHLSFTITIYCGRVGCRGWRCYKVIERWLIEVIDEGGSIIEIRPEATMQQLIPEPPSFFILPRSHLIPSHTSYIIYQDTCKV